jgi:hypothetical protein
MIRLIFTKIVKSVFTSTPIEQNLLHISPYYTKCQVGMTPEDDQAEASVHISPVAKPGATWWL